MRVNLALDVTFAPKLDTVVVRQWEGTTLTLAGVLYGIVVTVVGVLVAKAGRVVLGVYAGASLLLLLAGLTVFQQATIKAM